MTDPLVTRTAAEAKERAERAAIASARQHVGAAGFVQRDVLEHIIAAGHEQIALTQTLRQVVTSTQHQLESRSVALTNDPQAAVLGGIVNAGTEQIEVAQQLHQSIQHALADVRSTPLEEVSAQVLTTLSETVRRQASDLDQIIRAALDEADTPEQTAELEQMGSDTAAQLLSAQHDRSERELVTLSVIAQDAAARIRSLEADGQTHAAQKSAMAQEAHTAQSDIAALEAAERRSGAEIASLEQRSEQAQAHIEKLEASVAGRTERIERLHAELAEQSQRERQLEYDRRADPADLQPL
jgi:chromosome segregation ATPase